jgi:hypothetical protein
VYLEVQEDFFVNTRRYKKGCHVGHAMRFSFSTWGGESATMAEKRKKSMVYEKRKSEENQGKFVSTSLRDFFSISLIHASCLLWTLDDDLHRMAAIN